MNVKTCAALALGAAALLGTGLAQARPDVNWSVTIGSPLLPIYVGPPRVVVQPVPVWRAPVPVASHGYYRDAARWDRDGDGVPNRYDHVYNPRWDRDGDGIANRDDRHPNRPDYRHDGRRDDRHDRRH